MTSGVVREHSWYHTIELPDGTVTPGYFDTRGVPGKVQWPEGLRDGRCLDVGTFDGFWAFEMERRGAASVIALDLDDPEALDWSYDQRRRGPELVRAWGAARGRGFRIAADALGSRVERLSCSVYDLDPATHGRFDVVFCGAVLLHLRDPVRALERMRDICAGELVLVESLDPLLDLIGRRIASARFAPDVDQWWRPNAHGLARMVEVAGFHVAWTGSRLLVPPGKGYTHKRRPSLDGLAAGRPLQPGILCLPLRARPRAPADAA
jgi:tRNA (mo5U34)-methyltransferase